MILLTPLLFIPKPAPHLVRRRNHELREIVNQNTCKAKTQRSSRKLTTFAKALRKVKASFDVQNHHLTMDEKEVKLFGTSSSTYSYRVIWALKLKGLKYEFIEEDLKNKSDLLLQYNPVHKKVPVLVHGGISVSESMVIVEYIEEVWPEKYPLLPKDPYERSVARFWAKFVENLFPTISKFICTQGEEQEKAMKEILEMLRSIEEHSGLGEKKFFGGDDIGFADLAYGRLVHIIEVVEDTLGVKLVEAHTFPGLHAWIVKFKEVPVIKDNLPNREKLSTIFKRRRELLLASQ